MSDESLPSRGVDGVLQGEEQRRLWREVGGVARRTALKLVAQSRFSRWVVDDVVQETLIAVLQILPVWDRSRPLETWVIAVARSKTINVMREAQLHRRRPLDDLKDMAAPPAATAAERRLDVDRLIARLTPRGREIVVALAVRGEGVAEGDRRSVTSARR
jgi:RNA polymerase sigma factor (sigma-70 family)